MSDKLNVHAVQNMMLRGDPVGLAETRELIVRHILADPFNPANTEITEKLFQLYATIHARTMPGTLMKALSSGAQASQLMVHIYGELGARDAWQWPAAIPEEYGFYPYDIIAEVATAIASKSVFETGQ